jgi:hypothetical protein
MTEKDLEVVDVEWHSISICVCPHCEHEQEVPHGEYPEYQCEDSGCGLLFSYTTVP